MKTEHLMPREIAWITRCGVPSEIVGRSIERPAKLADLLRDKAFVGNRVYPQRKFRFAFVQIGRETTAVKFERDFRMLAPQPRQVRREKLCKTRRSGEPHARRLSYGLVLQLNHRVLDGLRVRHQHLAERRKLQAVFAADRDRRAEGAFERSQASANR